MAGLTFTEPFFDSESQISEDVEDKQYWRTVRHGFIRKVYGILATQLTVTSLLGAYFTMNSAAQAWIFSHVWVVIVCALVSVALIIALGCSKSLAQRFPHNYILLTIFTVCEAVTVGFICAQTALTSGQDVVLQAAVATSVIVVGLTIFACQTKYDFTSYQGVMFYLLIAASIFGLLTIFFHSPALIGLSCSFFALVMCAHIVYDTQILLNSGKVSASVDDYIFCAISLYLDIINLFIYLLRLLQLMKRDN
eukprot:Lankesteria_metandrocarpae@DN4571_c0_g1_i1.p1